MAHPLSAILLTKNEASFVERCIRRAQLWADEVVVVDSESTDATREIALSLGARVVLQPWLGWVPQRQQGIGLAKHDWVFCIEADEVADDELTEAIIKAKQNDLDPRNGYNVIRRDEYFGHLIPNHRNKVRQRAFIRMFNRKHSAYNSDQLIHEEVQLQGQSLALPGVLIHWRAFTLAEQMHRFTDYLELQSRQDDALGRRGTAVRLVSMPFLRFMWVYIAKGLWRVGTPGLVTAGEMACAEYLRWAALWEKQSVRRSLHPPEAVLRGRFRGGSKALTRQRPLENL
jgi:glycosyltransferase involved in cell wall biosynthesis